jgi:hypothetical protein
MNSSSEFAIPYIWVESSSGPQYIVVAESGIRFFNRHDGLPEEANSVLLANVQNAV